MPWLCRPRSQADRTETASLLAGLSMRLEKFGLARHCIATTPPRSASRRLLFLLVDSSAPPMLPAPPVLVLARARLGERFGGFMEPTHVHVVPQTRHRGGRGREREPRGPVIAAQYSLHTAVGVWRPVHAALLHPAPRCRVGSMRRKPPPAHALRHILLGHAALCVAETPTSRPVLVWQAAPSASSPWRACT